MQLFRVVVLGLGLNAGVVSAAPLSKGQQLLQVTDNAQIARDEIAAAISAAKTAWPDFDAEVVFKLAASTATAVANPTCDNIDGQNTAFVSSSCGSGYILKSDLTNTCSSATCEVADCCDQLKYATYEDSITKNAQFDANTVTFTQTNVNSDGVCFEMKNDSPSNDKPAAFVTKDGLHGDQTITVWLEDTNAQNDQIFTVGFKKDGGAMGDSHKELAREPSSLGASWYSGRRLTEDYFGIHVEREGVHFVSPDISYNVKKGDVGVNGAVFRITYTSSTGVITYGINANADSSGVPAWVDTGTVTVATDQPMFMYAAMLKRNQRAFISWEKGIVGDSTRSTLFPASELTQHPNIWVV